MGEAEGKHWLHSELCKRLPNCEVLGIDTNSAGVRQMRDKGFDVMVGHAEQMDFDTRFDTIVAGEVIEHLSNPGRFLEGCARILKPAGRVIVSTPNPFSLMYFLMYLKNFDRAFNPGHAFWFCPQSLRQLAERFGLSVNKLVFVDDLCPGLVTSRWYKTFAFCWKLVRVFLPKRFRNTIVAVLELG